MKIGNIFNEDRVNALRVDGNAYNNAFMSKSKENNVKNQTMEKVLFPEPYENARHYYNRQDFSAPQPPEPPQQNQSNQNQSNSNQSHQNNMQSMFNMQSLLPMLMSGKFNDVLKPLLSMFGGGNGGGGSGFDIAKIFELFKSKDKSKKVEKKGGEDVSSKFEDFIIIED